MPLTMPGASLQEAKKKRGILVQQGIRKSPAWTLDERRGLSSARQARSVRLRAVISMPAGMQTRAPVPGGGPQKSANFLVFFGGRGHCFIFLFLFFFFFCSTTFAESSETTKCLSRRLAATAARCRCPRQQVFSVAILARAAWLVGRPAFGAHTAQAVQGQRRRWRQGPGDRPRSARARSRRCERQRAVVTRAVFERCKQCSGVTGQRLRAADGALRCHRPLHC